MTDPTITGLVKRRAKLAGEIIHARNTLTQLMRDLDTLDGALKIIDPDIELPSIAPKDSKPKDDWSKRGDMSKHVLTMLRLSQRPLTAREIATQLVVDRGIAASPKFMTTMTRRVARCLRERRDQGLVENMPRTIGHWMEWRLSS